MTLPEDLFLVSLEDLALSFLIIDLELFLEPFFERPFPEILFYFPFYKPPSRV